LEGLIDVRVPSDDLKVNEGERGAGRLLRKILWDVQSKFSNAGGLEDPEADHHLRITLWEIKADLVLPTTQWAGGAHTDTPPQRRGASAAAAAAPVAAARFKATRVPMPIILTISMGRWFFM